jgi:hypothetical protein
VAAGKDLSKALDVEGKSVEMRAGRADLLEFELFVGVEAVRVG